MHFYNIFLQPNLSLDKTMKYLISNILQIYISESNISKSYLEH